jgi:hypothetical protein
MRFEVDEGAKQRSFEMGGGVRRKLVPRVSV